MENFKYDSSMESLNASLCNKPYNYWGCYVIL